MKRVVGIGGIFIKARDPEAFRAWYKQHLGIDVQDWGGTTFPWNRPGGMTAWSILPDASEYFAPSQAPFMVNYVVEDLHAVLDALRSEGCDVDAKVETSEFGSFGWVMDPEGNRIELWQAPESPMP
jgi:predicted enzyme related to lactoylglutathione lyase